MLNLTCRIAAVFLVIFGAQSIAPIGLASDYLPAATGGWGFDFAGANFAKKPGDDFFRYANGGLYQPRRNPPAPHSFGPSLPLRPGTEAPMGGRPRPSRERGSPSAPPHP